MNDYCALSGCEFDGRIVTAEPNGVLGVYSSMEKAIDVICSYCARKSGYTREQITRVINGEKVAGVYVDFYVTEWEVR